MRSKLWTTGAEVLRIQVAGKLYQGRTGAPEIEPLVSKRINEWQSKCKFHQQTEQLD